MSNVYCDCSFSVQMTADELKVWDQIMTIVEELEEEGGEITHTTVVEHGISDDLIRQVKEAADPHVQFGTPFNYVFGGPNGGGRYQVDFSADEYFNVDACVDYLSLWLKLIGSEECVYVDYAITGGGQARGGGVVVVAGDAHWYNDTAACWAVEGLKLDAHEMAQSHMHEHGVQCVAMMEKLLDFIDGDPLMKVQFKKFLEKDRPYDR